METNVGIYVRITKTKYTYNVNSYEPIKKILKI
jgi:hypothetical protein